MRVGARAKTRLHICPNLNFHHYGSTSSIFLKKLPGSSGRQITKDPFCMAFTLHFGLPNMHAHSRKMCNFCINHFFTQKYGQRKLTITNFSSSGIFCRIFTHTVYIKMLSAYFAWPSSKLCSLFLNSASLSSSSLSLSASIDSYISSLEKSGLRDLKDLRDDLHLKSHNIRGLCVVLHTKAEIVTSEAENSTIFLTNCFLFFQRKTSILWHGCHDALFSRRNSVKAQLSRFIVAI